MTLPERETTVAEGTESEQILGYVCASVGSIVRTAAGDIRFVIDPKAEALLTDEHRGAMSFVEDAVKEGKELFVGDDKRVIVPVPVGTDAFIKAFTPALEFASKGELTTFVHWE